MRAISERGRLAVPKNLRGTLGRPTNAIQCVSQQHDCTGSAGGDGIRHARDKPASAEPPPLDPAWPVQRRGPGSRQ